MSKERSQAINIPRRLLKYTAAKYNPPLMPPRKKAKAIKFPLPSIHSFCCVYFTINSYGLV
jgi:hypothetical protein